MGYHILKTNTIDLPHIHNLNQGALPAVSSITINDMTQFLEMADYFRVIKVKNNIAGFLIALTPGKDYHSPNYKWFEKNTLNSCILIELLLTRLSKVGDLDELFMMI